MNAWVGGGFRVLFECALGQILHGGLYSVPRVTGIKTETEPTTSVPKNQEPK